MTIDANGRDHAPAGARTGGRFTTTSRSEPAVELDETTTCLACGARGRVNDGGHLFDETGNVVCPDNQPDGHLAADGPGALHPAQVQALVRRVRRLQTSSAWAEGQLDMRPLMAAAIARLQDDGSERTAEFLAGVRTIMSSPAWQDGEVNVAPLLAEALDMLVPVDSGQRADISWFNHLLTGSSLSRSPELKLATVHRESASQPPSLVLPYTIFDGPSRRRQHIVLVLDAGRTVSTWCAGRQVDPFTRAQVWNRLVLGTGVTPGEAPALVADLMVGIDQR